MGALGKVKVDDVIRIPSAVKRFFDLKKGDYLEFYSERIFSEKLDEVIQIKIVRTKGKKK